jgi:hypothetical protein
MKSILSITFLMFFIFKTNAQSDIIYAEAYLNSINGPGYVAPFSDVVSANINTQLFPFRNASKISFHIGVIASRSFIPAGMKTHFGTSVGLEPDETHQVPTIFGDNQSKLVADLNNNVYIFPGGFALDQLTFLVPQISVSGIANTDFTFRYFEWSFNDDFEDIRLIGGGFRHHLTDYISLPDHLNLSLAYAFNYIEADAKTIENTSHYVLFEASYEPSVWRVFGNVAYVNSKVKIDYIHPETSIQFETNGGQDLRLGIGTGIQASIFNISAQLDLFSPITFSGFIGFSF